MLKRRLRLRQANHPMCGLTSLNAPASGSISLFCLPSRSYRRSCVASNRRHALPVLLIRLSRIVTSRGEVRVTYELQHNGNPIGFQGLRVASQRGTFLELMFPHPIQPMQLVVCSLTPASHSSSPWLKRPPSLLLRTHSLPQLNSPHPHGSA